MEKRFLVISLLLLLITASIYSQPNWAIKIPEGYINDFFVGRGISKISKAESIQFAFEDAIGSIIKNGRINVTTIENYNDNSAETFSNGQSVSLDVISKIAKEIIIEGSSRIISNLKEVETYSEQLGNYFDAYVLVSIPKAKPISPPNSFSPVWRSFLLPGWGQLYKGQTFRGISFMTLTFGGIAGGIILKQLKVDAANKAFSSRTQARRDFYNNESKNFNTYSLISFISAGVFYAWSLVDAITVKNENLYVEINFNRDICSFQFSLCL